MALRSSADEPLPVRTVALAIGAWVARLGRVWVEGQVTEISRRPGAATVFLTLRDPVADVSLRVTCAQAVCAAIVPPLADGARVVVWAKPDFYLGRGSLSLTAYDIRPVGVGELLVRLERLRAMLAAEGLFAAQRKRGLPFLPRAVGVVCGRGSAAERDVLDTARRRWPAVRFAVRTVAVQGPLAVSQLCAAVRDLDANDDVDVIVIARGGGSVEDLLAFSDESLCRLVSACRTPVVSAIGHEQDAPLLDLVADVRAGTPTDAARRVVPDVAQETARVAALRDRLLRAVTQRVDRESAGVSALRSRPVLADPLREITRRVAEVSMLAQRAQRGMEALVTAAVTDLTHTRARVTALSPAATLARGYAVVQRPDGAVVRTPRDVENAQQLAVRLAHGTITVIPVHQPS